MPTASNMAPCAAFPRLAPGEVREIRQMFAAHAGLSTICDKFGITRDHVFEVCRYGRQASHSQPQNKQD